MGIKDIFFVHRASKMTHYERNKRIGKWVANPVNPEENFADKWIEYPQREKNFYKWLDQVEHDIQSGMMFRFGKGIYNHRI